MSLAVSRRLERLAEELSECGLVIDGSRPWHELALPEIDYALRPPVFERRVPTYGAVLAPGSDPDGWTSGTMLSIALRPMGSTPLEDARRFADGDVSWVVRSHDGDDAWALFDRPGGSERDLVVIADVFDAVIVQRDSTGTVRVVGEFGVFRWNGLDWHHQPPLSAWIDAVQACGLHGSRDVLTTALEFAVHDLGARGIGAILVYSPDWSLEASFDKREPAPPPLELGRPADLGPLRHALSQIDGAALFDRDGTLRALGVRLVPSSDAESSVDGYRGTRHTAGRRYSYDDPQATVIVVSEDGPVTVHRAGRMLGASPQDH